MKIGVLGATGPAGGGLAARLASLGYDVIAGSRDPRPRRSGRRGSCATGGATASAGSSRAATRTPPTAELVVVGRQWEAAVRHGAPARRRAVRQGRHLDGQRAHEGRPRVPSGAPRRGFAHDGDASGRAARPASPPRFQHIPAAALGDLDHAMESDVIVCADDDDARNTVLDLVATIPDLRGFDGGSLANAVGIEAFAAVLLTVNLRHKGKASLRLVGVEPRPPSGPMTLRIHDTAQRALVPFEAGPVVRMYVCGITPYDSTHLGPRRHVHHLRPPHPAARGARPRGAHGAQRDRRRRLDPAQGPRARRRLPGARRRRARPLPGRHGRAGHAAAGGGAPRHRGDRRDDRHGGPAPRLRPRLPDARHRLLRRLDVPAVRRAVALSRGAHGPPRAGAGWEPGRPAPSRRRSTSSCGSRPSRGSRRGARPSASAGPAGISSAR